MGNRPTKTITTTWDNTNRNNMEDNRKDTIQGLDELAAKDNNLQSQLDNLVVGAGTSPVEVQQARVDKNGISYVTLDARLEAWETKTDKLKEIIVSITDFGADVNSSDNFQAIQNAIDYVYNAGGGEIQIPIGTFKYKQTLNAKDKVYFSGKGDVTGASVLDYQGIGFAIVTTGNHQRNKFKNLKIETNGKSSGIRLGDVYANLPAGITPIMFSFDTVSITSVGVGFKGIEMFNCSHINMIDVKMGFGSSGGGIGLKITADYYNSGVFSATNCIFGRVDNNDTGLLIDAPINLDSYTFTNCYFGGEKPIRLIGANYVRSINFLGCHAEARKLAGSTATDLIAVEIGAVLGGSWIGGSITAFGVANSSAFAFTDRAKKFNVFAIEANAIMEAVFKNKSATIIEGCILQEGNLANSSTAAQFVGTFSDVFKFGVNMLTLKNITTDYIFYSNGLKEYFASAPNKTLSHTRGDIVKNTVPYPAKNITHWKCETTGTASATFIAYGTGWGTTTEKPTNLTTDDKGYWYKNTETGSLQMWNGTAWI
jgi:hypothetical protein